MNKIGWKGLSFPFRITNGKVETSSTIVGKDNYKHTDDSIRQILGTVSAERPTASNIGIVNTFLFTGFTNELIPYYKQIIKEVVEDNDTRLTVESIDFDSTEIQSGLVKIRLLYKLNMTNIPHLLEYNIDTNGGVY